MDLYSNRIGEVFVTGCEFGLGYQGGDRVNRFLGGGGYCRLSFASLSAASFPLMPVCPGTQRNECRNVRVVVMFE